MILFAPNFTETALELVSSEGGKVTQATKLDSANQELAHRFPKFLPDGKHFLFTVRTKQTDTTGVYIGQLDSNEKKLLFAPYNYNAEYTLSGYLLWDRERNLVARAFDLQRLQLTGEAFAVAERIGYDGAYYSFSVSKNDVLCYSNVDIVNTQLGWFDRAGKETAFVGEPTPYLEPWFSPDEKKMALGRIDLATGLSDIWIVEFARHHLRKRRSKNEI